MNDLIRKVIVVFVNPKPSHENWIDGCFNNVIDYLSSHSMKNLVTAV
jgi:hypothetical protein